jgi:chorismate synthase
VASHTVGLGSIEVPADGPRSWAEIVAAEGTALRCADPALERRLIELIDEARRSGDSIGGCFQVVARGVPAGLGSHRHWDLRLSARLTAAVGSIPSVKAIAVGDGVEAASARGSEFHDAIFYDRRRRRFHRRTNRAGGIEGGISNGEEIRLRAYVKPLSTLPRPLHSVDLRSKKAFLAQVERTDVSAIAAAGVVGESMTAFVLAEAMVEKFGGDSVGEMTRNHRAYLRQVRDY